MSFPHFSNIAKHVTDKLAKRKSNPELISQLNCWVRVTSGTGPGGLVLLSNPNYNLFKAAGSKGTGIYGNEDSSGTVGRSWAGKPIGSPSGQGYRPSPIISSLEIDEGAGNLSRKASFTITAFSKEQMETLSRYFMEPGYSVFIEWGWNTASGVGGLQSLDKATISNFQSMVNTQKVRESSGGDYDNYLGFMTGGSLSLDGDKWTISVNCTGYTELPSYLLTTETGEDAESAEAKLNSAPSYGTDFIDDETDIGRQRWMTCFNLLPETRRTETVKSLIDTLGFVENFINFDDEVSEDINDETDGRDLAGITFSRSAVVVDGQEVVFPKGTKIVGEQKFIKFSALMEIIAAIGFEGYYLGGDESKLIQFKVITNETYCSAFKNIYSTNPDKLFIPNPDTPKFKLAELTFDSTINDLISTDSPIDNSVNGVVFPSQSDITFTPNAGGEVVTKTAGNFGKLDDLYVNFNFAAGILGTSNFFVKDALYQILNGISSAVNGMWNFQIQEDEIKGTGTTELRIHELNFISDGKKTPVTTFDLIGDSSVFMDASLDLDISGAKMNQIIGQRLSIALNKDASVIPERKGLWSDQKDLLEVLLKKKTDVAAAKTRTAEDEANLKEENLNIILGKSFFYPRVEMTERSAVYGMDLYKLCYLGAFRDTNIFSAMKQKWNKNEQKNSVSPLMPINFSFTIHGISGIKRGDMFKVRGIPTQYTNGFFQVLSVKHVLDGMVWKTEVTGGFRR